MNECWIHSYGSALRLVGRVAMIGILPSAAHGHAKWASGPLLRHHRIQKPSITASSSAIHSYVLTWVHGPRIDGYMHLYAPPAR